MGLNYLDIHKHLPKTDCRDCGQASCLVFAMNLARGTAKPEQCPHLDPEALALLRGGEQTGRGPEQGEERLKLLREEFSAIDLARRAEVIAAEYSGGQLHIPCLGKPFSLDARGNLISQCHVNPWVTIPLLNYALHCRGVAPRGPWLPFRELAGGRRWRPLFEQRCEKPFREVIDGYTDLFADLINIFEAREAEDGFGADISVIIRPLPLVPLMISYWKPEDGMASDLSLFFDARVEENLPAGPLYTLTVGLLTMFEQIARTHGA